MSSARHDITAHVVESNPILSRHGGVAAVLSRGEPWEPISAGAVGGAAHGAEPAHREATRNRG
jgi:hypothetical protein